MLLPVPVASIVIGLFALDLGWAVSNVVPLGQGLGVSDFFSHGVSWRIGADLAGLAIAGGVFIVPAFAATQTWAPADRRARIVAAVNVLNAAFHGRWRGRVRYLAGRWASACRSSS